MTPPIAAFSGCFPLLTSLICIEVNVCNVQCGSQICRPKCKDGRSKARVADSIWNISISQGPLHPSLGIYNMEAPTLHCSVYILYPECVISRAGAWQKYGVCFLHSSMITSFPNFQWYPTVFSLSSSLPSELRICLLWSKMLGGDTPKEWIV